MLRTCCYLLLLFLAIASRAQELDRIYTYLEEQKLDSAEILLEKLPQSPKQLALKAYINDMAGKKQKAILFYHEALGISTDAKLNFDCHKNLAAIFQALGLYSESLKQYSAAEDILFNDVSAFTEETTSKETFSLNMNKGLLFFRSNRDSAALTQFQSILPIANNTRKRHQILTMIGILSVRQSNFLQAIEAYDSIIYSSEITSYTGKAHHNKAMSLKALGKDPLPDLYKALEYKEGKERFVTLMDLGELTGDLTVLAEALQHYPREADPDDYKIYRIMERLYEQKGDMEKAQQYDELYARAGEQYIDMMRESKQLAQQFATANTLAQYEAQKRLKAEEVANQRRNNWIIFVLSLAALTGIGFFLWVRKSKQNMKQQLINLLRS